MYFICIYFLQLTLEGRVKRVTLMFNSLSVWVMVLLFTPCPNSFFVQPKNLWPHFIVISLFSVFITCTVLLNFASTVMIKWWLSSSVTLPCRCYCLGLKCITEIQFKLGPCFYLSISEVLKYWIQGSFKSSSWEHSGGEKGYEREETTFVSRHETERITRWWGDFILGFYLFVSYVIVFFYI